MIRTLLLALLAVAPAFAGAGTDAFGGGPPSPAENAPAPALRPMQLRLARVPAAVEAQILAIEDDRRDDARLVALARDESPDVRSRAALALGRIGSTEGARLLVSRLRLEPDPAVRAQVAFALGLAGRLEATKALVLTMARDPAVAVRTRAAQALGFLPSPLATRSLIAALPPPGITAEGERADLVAHTVTALVRHKDPRAIPDLERLAIAGSGAVRRAAVWGLARFKAGAHALAPLVRDPDALVRAWAIRGLADTGQARAADIEPLLSDPDLLVREHAVVAAGAAKAASLAPRLEVIAVRSDPAAPSLAIDAVNSLGKAGARRSIPFLKRMRKGPGLLARAADVALARLAVSDRELHGDAALGPPGGTAGWGVLDWITWVEALGVHGTARSRRELVAIASAPPPGDPHGIARAAAINALAEKPDASDGPRFSAWLADPDLYVRSAALEGLAKVRGPASAGEIEAAYQRALSDSDFDVRMSAVTTAADWKKPAGDALLTRASNDPSRVVRVKARAALAERAGRVRGTDPGPVGMHLPPEFYAAAASAGRPHATIRTTAGSFTIELLPEHAALTVASFRRLARRGYFDGQLVPRVVPGFVTQMGDPRGDWAGSPGYTLRCEVNPLAYHRGAVGMALSGKDTGGSQFFVTHARHPHLDGIYTIFGQVVSGMETVDRIRRGDRILAVTVD